MNKIEPYDVPDLKRDAEVRAVSKMQCFWSLRGYIIVERDTA